VGGGLAGLEGLAVHSFELAVGLEHLNDDDLWFVLEDAKDEGVVFGADGKAGTVGLRLRVELFEQRTKL